MKCAKAKNLISAFSDGELDERQCAAVRHHLDVCPDCARQYVHYEASLGELRADFHALAVSVTAPDALWTSVSQALADKPAPHVPNPWERASARFSPIFDATSAVARNPVGAASYAAVLILCVVAALSALFWSALRQPNTALCRTETKKLVTFTARLTNNGEVLTDAKSRRYVLVLDSRERWLR